MRHRALLSCFLGSVLALGAWADEAPPGPTPQYFGLSAGYTTGVGLSYRIWDGPWGVQLTALPVWSPASSFWSAGVSGLFLIEDHRWSRFFGYGGSSVDLGSDPWVDKTAQVGGGLGLEFVVFDHLALDVQAGLATTWSLSRAQWQQFGFTGEAGIFYRL